MNGTEPLAIWAFPELNWERSRWLSEDPLGNKGCVQRHLFTEVLCCLSTVDATRCALVFLCMLNQAYRVSLKCSEFDLCFPGNTLRQASHYIHMISVQSHKQTSCNVFCLRWALKLMLIDCVSVCHHRPWTYLNKTVERTYKCTFVWFFIILCHI